MKTRDIEDEVNKNTEPVKSLANIAVTSASIALITLLLQAI